ncbi:MAG: hypothetical protein AB1306_02120 [Nitrospirota bacterium]
MKFENLLLISFCVLPFVFGIIFLFCFRKRRDVQQGKINYWLFTGNVALFLFLAAFFLSGGEIYFRFLYDQSDSFTQTLTGQAWYNKHYHLNSWGIRDSIEYLQYKNTEKPRITFLGDSFTAGHGITDVEKRFANRIRALRPDWEIQVFGFNGFDSIDEADFLKTVSPEYYFDNVLLVYVLNDISKVMPAWEESYNAIYSLKPPYLAAQSYLLNTLYFRWKRARLPGVMNYFDFTLAAYEDASIWEIQQNTLLEITKEVEARGGKLLVVTFPFMHSLWQNYEFQSVHKQLANFWSTQGVPHLDLLDVFQSYAPEKLTVNPYDAHPNERAHALAAEAINKFLSLHIRQKN